MLRNFLPVLAGCLLLAGCAGVKSSFDCDATTSDTCMTMGEANQVARNKAAKNKAGKLGAGGLPSLADIPQAAVAPSQPAVALPATLPSHLVTTPAATSVTAGRSVGAGSPVAATSVPVATAPRPALSCQTVRCDTPGAALPQRTADRIATVWIAPWIDSDNHFHQPGRVSFVVTPSTWVLPRQIN